MGVTRILQGVTEILQGVNRPSGACSLGPRCWGTGPPVPVKRPSGGCAQMCSRRHVRTRRGGGKRYTSTTRKKREER